MSEVIEATGHTYGEWTTIKEPTQDEEGIEERECSNCGHKETRTTPKLQNNNNNGGIVIGVVIGSLFIILLVAIIVIAMSRKKKNR